MEPIRCGLCLNMSFFWGGGKLGNQTHTVAAKKVLRESISLSRKSKDTPSRRSAVGDITPSGHLLNQRSLFISLSGQLSTASLPRTRAVPGQVDDLEISLLCVIGRHPRNRFNNPVIKGLVHVNCETSLN